MYNRRQIIINYSCHVSIEFSYSNQIHCHLWNTVRNTHIQFHSISIPRDGLFDLRGIAVFTLNDLAAHMRLHNFFHQSGASEEKVESFITNISAGYVPPERMIELVNQLHEISKKEPILFDQVPEYIEGKLQEKLRIDEAIKESDS